NLINQIDDAMGTIVDARAQLGALQNRLEFNMSHSSIASENMSDTISRIRDADIAYEMMRTVQASLIHQTAVAMLAQSNQMPQMVLGLLDGNGYSNGNGNGGGNIFGNGNGNGAY
ncbi:MAG: hypothetical protein FWC67_00895, partial [Defluviitaleaceae bacterium]|nr:hypothetical protein [Defluviitaleaceae bacterium]